MFVCCERCVLSGRGLCDDLINRPEEPYRLWCVVLCDLENLKNEEAMTPVGSQSLQKKNDSLGAFTSHLRDVTITLVLSVLSFTCVSQPRLAVMRTCG